MARFQAVQVLESRLSGPLLLAPVVHGDARGFFQEVYRRNVFAELGINDDFVQDNHSRSRRGIVRGMHFQTGMAKLVRCVRGAIYDVLVDIRPGSTSFGAWEGFRLDDVENHQLYCPDGFAHGFCVVSEIADVIYKTSSYYAPELESGFAYNDPEVAIEWPADVELLASPRDVGAPALRELDLGPVAS
jgi:dTDP-4-dehydrorhamnose 3,5-epimerase